MTPCVIPTFYMQPPAAFGCIYSYYVYLNYFMLILPL